MAMGRRAKRKRQQDLWIAAADGVRTPANAFYDRLNEVLDFHRFDKAVEHLKALVRFDTTNPPGN
jgi:hypothetical protein